MEQEHDFAWADRGHAEAMAEKHNGVLLALLADEDWVTAEEADKAGAQQGHSILGWGVSSEDGESMLDEDEEWVIVA